jgi:hypothetical protein
MKMKRMLELLRPQEELIASFGQAQLVRTLDGKTEFRGGTAEDRQKAKEWISMFWQESMRAGRSRSPWRCDAMPGWPTVRRMIRTRIPLLRVSSRFVWPDRTDFGIRYGHDNPSGLPSGQRVQPLNIGGGGKTWMIVGCRWRRSRLIWA